MAEEEKGFTIKDRRAFSPETGEARPEEVAEPKDVEQTEKETSAREEEMSADAEQIPLPEVEFSTFVFSLSSSALFHFGEVPDPLTGKKQENLPLAKQTIDILGMLEEKTKGNLTEEEGQLLKNILFDLRMRYVRKKK